MQCEQFRAWTDAYCREDLDEADRRQWREHFAGCSDCRNRAVERDPTLLFLSPELIGGGARAGHEAKPVWEAEVERCVASVATMIRQEKIGRQVRAARRRQRSPWWLAAAALVICTVGAMLWQLSGLDGGRGATVLHGPDVAAQSSGPVAQQPPTVEVEMEDVRVYQFSQADDEVVEVLIVNPALEL